ncbi:hypothetical protein J2X31_003480 [Flavobacterium arsenatis]|uniref:Uncharacterized protein n=1 Tax=Flavobacterium arsenatis TaxID=1484332 RepID=A0ABU1TU88_9FLAO|nr:hypothetical protein [Flavobacterium arsenatis]MDR6969449.1 hypothetical protein [Flavobacterium arsenatis]
MNTKTILSLVFVASLFFTSCKKELEPQESSDTPSTEETVATPENPIEVTPQAEPTATAVTPQPVQQSTTVAPTAPGMNPPHGQPNHRCDIAVGAPLNSPKKATLSPHDVPKPTSLEQPAPKTLQTQPVTTETAPGMNPPHGQPGHRCEIAVGAPLPTE